MSDAEEPLAKQWERSRGTLIELPSGKRARVVVSLNMPLAIKKGLIPNPLRSVIEKSIAEPGSEQSITWDVEMVEQLNNLVNNTICDAMIDPKCHIPPEDAMWGTWRPEDPRDISIADLSMEDRDYIYSVAQGGAADLESFRRNQKQYVESMANGEGVQKPAKRPARAQRARKRV